MLKQNESLQPTEHTPNEASKALKKWRLSQKDNLGKQQFPSGRSLADWITKKIKEKEPGAKLIVYQPDVSKAERGWPGPLEKVITALYNYCEVTPGLFGELEYTSPEDRAEVAREGMSEYISKLQTEITDAQKVAMDALSKIIALQDENKALQTENSMLKEALRKKGAKS